MLLAVGEAEQLGGFGGVPAAVPKSIGKATLLPLIRTACKAVPAVIKDVANWVQAFCVRL